MTRKEWLNQAQKRLESSGSSTSRLDAEVLLAHVLEVERIHLHMYPEQKVEPDDLETVETLIRRREKGEPVAYLTGTQEFMGLNFFVSPAALIPRPETELLVETVLAELKDRHCLALDREILAADIGSGSGCIAVSLAVLMPRLKILAVDLSEEALQNTRKNIRRQGVSNQVVPLRGDLLEPVEAWLEGTGKLDALISNPPYIPDHEMAELPASVADYEPPAALAGGVDGLDFYRTITAGAPALLRSGGLLAFEVGYQQGDAVTRLLEEQGFVEIRLLKDLAGLARVVLGKMP